MPRLLLLLRCSIWTLSGLLLAFVALCYWRRFDACAAVTVYPPWCWMLVGLFMAWLGYSRRRWALSGTLIASWLVFLLAFADSPRSLLRALLPAPQRGASLRVVSLNCAGSAEAAREIISLDPDIVLIQESPTAETLAALANDLFGPGAHLVRGVDASIIARGNITAAEVPPRFREDFVNARVEIDGSTIDVISLRLYPCPIRLDLWTRECWCSYQSNRETRRRQLEKIASYLHTIPARAPLILGGDFNAPPGDAAFRLLRPRLTDSFTVAGRGWGATIIDIFDWPLIRIDQIWTSPQLRATNVFAQKTRFTDHRMVVGDFSLNDNPR